MIVAKRQPDGTVTLELGCGETLTFPPVSMSPERMAAIWRIARKAARLPGREGRTISNTERPRAA
jgi:hypothetical protein